MTPGAVVRKPPEFGESTVVMPHSMEFVFTGFRQDKNVRHYGFEGVAADRSRVEFSVGTDLTLLRKYSIALQEVPLLCRRLLETQAEGERPRAVTFTEQDMRRYAADRAAAREAAAQKKKPHRAPASNKVGQAWRGFHP